MSKSKNEGSNKAVLRWLIAAVCVTFLIATSTSWQSWNRNTGLSSVTTLPLYFIAVWASYLLWIAVAFLIYRWQRWVPMLSESQSLWWLIHLGLSIAVGITHLLVDTAMLWFALSQNFNFTNGVIEKLLQWLPYELLAYWAILSAITLLANRTKLFTEQAKNYLERLSYKDQDETKLIAVEKIDYIEACDNYVKICCRENQELIKMTMSYLESHLDPKCFMRVHRSFIVNLNSLASINRQDPSPFLVLTSGKSIPISRRRKADLRKRLANTEQPA